MQQNIISYEKRKNTKLFQSLKNLHIATHSQNYLPIYERFFMLNENNQNCVNLNHAFYVDDIVSQNEHESLCIIKKTTDTNSKGERKKIFIKNAPLIDPFKYIVGKYKFSLEELNALPVYGVVKDDNKYDPNNRVYIESLFLYLCNQLLNVFQFPHGLEYYGSFLTVKEQFKLNIADDLEYIIESDFFIKNKNVLFQVDESLNAILMDYTQNKPKINILEDGDGNEETISIDIEDIEDLNEGEKADVVEANNKCVSSLEEEMEPATFFAKSSTSSKSSYSNSSCSSNSSHTDVDDFEDFKECGEKCENSKDKEEDDESDGSEDEEEDEDDGDDEEEEINITFPQFPVQMIFMELCSDTLDNLTNQCELGVQEWLSALMQIIMILITYQKCFQFTHNDLHTNNIMYNKTTKKYIYYVFDNKKYKVPTFGRIFKIIDFGRSIFTFQNKVFCSNSFKQGEDASTQYNTEPYFNPKRPRLEPNYSFDLCRLGCSLFDYFIEDTDNIPDMATVKNPVIKLVMEWCTDDNGLNLLYKKNGDERYPDFKLYKMIARRVHNHSPTKQLERTEFKQFVIAELPTKKKDCWIVNIDKIVF